MKKIIYSNFTEFIISDNAVSTIDFRINTFSAFSKIYCHAVDKLSNCSLKTINSRSNELIKPISCILTLYVKINGIESVRTYDLSNYIESDINFFIDLLNIKDVNGKTLAESGTITTTDTQYQNANFTFTLTKSIKYKSETLSFFIRVNNIDLIEF